MKISIDDAVSHLEDFVSNCDADELARILGDVFGGNCFAVSDEEDDGSDIVLSFEPNENYAGEFNDLKDDDYNEEERE
jgi:hypothetical protein